MKLSLVVPCYNEADNVALFQQAVISAFDGCGYDYEIVFIDDGSRDATLHNLKKLYAAQQCPVKVVSFSRNFGKEAGIYAGLQHAAGDYICLIDADLQQRPEIVRDMVKILDEEPEFDVVAAFQDRRGEGKVLSFFKKCFYSIINKLSKVTLQPDASYFRTFRRSVRDSILEELLSFVSDEEHAVLLSSHITGDLEKIADYIVKIADEGEAAVPEVKAGVLEMLKEFPLYESSVIPF